MKSANKMNPADCQKRHLFWQSADSRRYVKITEN